MARIVFLLEHEEGHLNPTFPLARRLQARGHGVTYMGLADGSGYIRSQGFDFHPIFEQLVPAGTLRTQREVSATVPAGDHGAEMRLAQQTGPASIFLRLWLAMVVGEPSLEQAMRSLRPDLLVLTSFFAPYAVVLRYRYGVPIVLLTPLLRTHAKSRYAEMLGDLLMELGGAEAAAFSDLVRRADPGVRTMRDIAGRMMALREVILCPVDLELPAARHDREPEVYYAEASVDLQRKSEQAFPWDLLDPRRKLLYVSLGSQSYRADRDRVSAFLRATSAAFLHRPDWQVVLSTGGLLRAEEVAAPAGTIVAGWAPQIDLLRRARVAITHGGLGTVKECIFFGVPMVVFPISHDQPDNARRVVHHELGTAGDLGNFSPESIHALVESADHPAVRASVERMRQRFLAVEESGLACRLIEEILPR
ncbi:MAG TPA: glycosyltransferase [Thermoanaerobaculia bacterium]|nr:glycosyltransferase [Thermoanaerobaculia bacterium]